MPLIFYRENISKDMTFEFLNGKFFDISKLKAGFRINSDNSVLKKYDKNNNSIFDSEELEQFRSDIEPYLEDGRIDESETESLGLKILGVKDKAEQLVESALYELSYEQAKQVSVETLNQEVEDALETFYIAKKGPASSVANAFKELFNTEYAASKVYRNLLMKKVSAELLDRAQNTDMTMKTYLEAKTKLFSFLLRGKEGKPTEEQIKAYLKYITPEELDIYIQELAAADDNQYDQVRNKIILTIEDRMHGGLDGNSGIKYVGTNSIADIMANPALYDKIIDFEKMFKLEYGVEFNPDNISEYESKKQELQLIMLAKNKIVEVSSMLQQDYAPLENVVMQDTPNYFQYMETHIEYLKRTIVYVLKNLNGSDEAAINDYIKNLGFDNISLQNGELIIPANLRLESKAASLVELAKAIENNLNDTYRNNILNGMSEEEYAIELEKAHAKAYGSSNPIDLAGEFAKSQREGANYVKIATEGGIAILAVVTGGVAAAAGSALKTVIVTATGIVLSVGSGAAIDAAEAKSKYGEITEETKQEIWEELKINGILSLAGLGIGGAAGNIGAAVAKKCPKLLRSLARIVGEYGSDFVMSCLVDYVITGELSLSFETIGELMNMAVGIAARKNIGKAVNRGKNQQNQKPAKTETKKPETTPEPNNTVPRESSVDEGVNRKKQKRVIQYIKRQKIDEKYRAAAEDRMDHGVPPELFAVMDDPIKLEKYIKEHTVEEPLYKQVYNEENGRYETVQCGTRTVIKVGEDCCFYSREDFMKQIEHLKNLREFLDTQSIPEDITVWRQSSYDFAYNININGQNLAEILQNAIKNGNVDEVIKMLNSSGIEVKYDNFVGTSMENHYNPNNPPAVMWEINVPKGSKGAYIEAMTRNNISSEAEFLLQAGSTLKIKQIEFKNGTWFIKAEVVQQPQIKATEPKNNSDNNQSDVNSGRVEEAPSAQVYSQQGQAIKDKIETANSREDFAEIRDMLKEMPAGEEKTRLAQMMQEKYRAYISGKPDVRMEYGAQGRQYYEIKLENGDFETLSGVTEIILAGEYRLDLSDYMEYLNRMPEGECITVGRSSKCDIVVPEQYGHVSNEHLIIIKRGGKLYIKDTSRHGTTIYKHQDGNNYNVQTTSSARERLYRASGGDEHLLNKMIQVFGNDEAYIDKIASTLNGNNKIILETYLNNPRAIMNGSHPLSKDDLALLIMFNRNNKQSYDLISNPREVKMFLRRANQEIDNLARSYGYHNHCSNKEVRDAILYSKTKLKETEVECSPNHNILNDMENLIHGRDYIQHFSSINEAMYNTQVGDAVTINGKMYVNDGSQMVPLQLSEARFRELFPPMQRFTCHQGAVGDCYLVATIDALANNPYGRAKLYQMIGEDSNGIYTMCANGNGQKTYFERFTTKYKNMYDGNGLAIIEAGYCQNSRGNAFDARMTAVMERNDGGFSTKALYGLLGVEGGYFWRHNDVAWTPEKKEQIKNIIKQHAGKDNIVIMAGTKKIADGSDRISIDAGLDIYQTHEYSIKGYDETTDSVIVSNPAYSGVEIKIPMDKFLDYFSDFNFLFLD